MSGFTRTLYVGDGGNDLCPSLLLGENDRVLARTNYTLAKKLASQEHNVTATVLNWTDGKEALAHFREHSKL